MGPPPRAVGPRQWRDLAPHHVDTVLLAGKLNMQSPPVALLADKPALQPPLAAYPRPA